MVFSNDLSLLSRPSNVEIDLLGAKFPNANDLFFRSKQEELVRQYEAARIFMYETETNDWNHWFEPIDDPTSTEAFRQIFRSHFYEAALFYYNIVVDLSWTLCYVTIEYACRNRESIVNISGIKPIEEAAELLRIAEGNVTSPTAENNPFGYLKLMCPDFEPVIDQIVDFWNSFSATETRRRYNYCKHKGRPSYEEIENLKPGRLIGLYKKGIDNGELIQIATDSRDVGYSFSLESAIIELKDFDNNTLFPYIQNLIKSIENILQPSPMII